VTRQSTRGIGGGDKISQIEQETVRKSSKTVRYSVENGSDNNEIGSVFDQNGAEVSVSVQG
jgi:hypothetical protein